MSLPNSGWSHSSAVYKETKHSIENWQGLGFGLQNWDYQAMRGG